MPAKGTTPDDAAWAAALAHRPKYAKHVAEYSGVYEVTERGIKKWIERARSAWIANGCPNGGPQFPPLDDPAKMLDWWTSHMTLAPSELLLSFGGQPAGGTQPDEPPPNPPRPRGASSPRSGVVNFDEVEGLDMASALKRAQKTLGVVQKHLEEALCNPNTDESTITLRSNRVEKSSEQVRKLEKAYTERLKEAGDLVPRAALRAELSPMFEALASSLVGELVDHLGIDRARALIFVDNWFGMLRVTRFLTDATPRLTPTTAAA